MSATPAILPPPTDAGPFVERLRAVHLSMVDGTEPFDERPGAGGRREDRRGGRHGGGSSVTHP